MKKINVLKLLLGLSIITFTVSCSQLSGGNTGTDYNEVDLRNYNSEGDVYRSASGNNDNYIFSSEVANDYYNFYRKGYEYFGGADCPDWVLNSVTIEDCEDGIKIVYHRPQGIPDFSDKPMAWFSVDYIDGNGNLSTSTTIPYDQMNDCYDASGNWELKIRDSFSVLFPLVLPGKEIHISVHYGYGSQTATENDIDDIKPSDTGNNDNEFAIVFKVFTAHGKACIKDLPKNFTTSNELGQKSVNHVKIKNETEGLIFSTSGVIPPEGKNLRRAYHIIEASSNDKYFGDNWNDVGWVDEAVENPKNSDKINLLKFKVAKDNNNGLSHSKNLPYIFCQFNYSYELEEYPGIIFRTPILTTSIIESDKLHSFKTNEEFMDFLIKFGYMNKITESQYEFSLSYAHLVAQYLNPEKDYTFVITDELPNVWDKNWKAFKSFTGKISFDFSKTKLKEIPGWSLFSKPEGDPDCFMNIVSVILPETLEEIGDTVLSGTSINSLIIPANSFRVGANVVPEGATVEFADSNNWYWCWEGEDGAPWTEKDYTSPKWNPADFDSDPYTNDWRRYAKISE